MEQLNNKRISTETIKQIALLLDDHYKQMNALYTQYKTESEDYKNPANEQIKDIVVSSKPRLTFSVTIGGEQEEREDVEWFIQSIKRDAKFLEKTSIHYYGSLRRDCSNNNSFSATSGEESFSLSLQPNYAYHSSSINNPSRNFDEVLYKIRTLLSSAPTNYDKTIKGKNMRENFPSMVYSMIGGIVLTLVIALLFRFMNVNIGIEWFICSPYFAPVMLALSIVVGLIIPGPNHSLYKKLDIKQRYSRYNRNTGSDVYEIDVKSMTDYCEVEIGANAEHGRIREKIEKNFSTSLKMFAILLGAFALVCVILAFV